MDFRIINDETLPKIMELWDYCFEKNDTPFFKWYFNEYCLKENMVLGGFDEKSEDRGKTGIKCAEGCKFFVKAAQRK